MDEKDEKISKVMLSREIPTDMCSCDTFRDVFGNYRDPGML
jgi:hypothetical protein